MYSTRILLAIVILFSFCGAAKSISDVPKTTTGFSNTTEQQEFNPNQIIVKYRENAAKQVEKELSRGKTANDISISTSLDQLNKSINLKNIKPLFKNFKQNEQKMQRLQNHPETQLTKKEKHILKRQRRVPQNITVPALDRIYLVEVEPDLGQSLEDIVEQYNSDPQVEYAELDCLFDLFNEPNDSYFDFQWALNNTGQEFPSSGRFTYTVTADADIDAPEAWNIRTDSDTIIIAVIDTGIDYTHRDIIQNLFINGEEIPENNIDDDGNGYVDDYYGYHFLYELPNPIDKYGHGTHCAGIIAAAGNNGYDIAGVCWQSKIMALSVSNSTGSLLLSDAIEAILYATENGADILSNSWGGTSYNQSLQDAINYAYSQGLVFVAAAGNSNSSSYHYPAAYNHVLAVAATDPDDNRATFSNYGEWVDIAAPGVDILSLRADGTSMGTVYDAYTTIASGTSMACPHVAGACGLLLAQNNTLSPDEVMEIIMESGDSIADGICASDARLNIHRMLQNALTSKGYVTLDTNSYSCSSAAVITVGDADLAGEGDVNASVVSSNGDSETLTLSEDSVNEGIFAGTISTTGDTVVTEDGYLQVIDGGSITVTYQDEDNGSGNPAAVTDAAAIDCDFPDLVRLEYAEYPLGQDPNVLIEADEIVLAKVFYGTTAGGPYEHENYTYGTVHNIRLLAAEPNTHYYFEIYLEDDAGNVTVYDNNEQYYELITNVDDQQMYVPGEYETIQDAVDAAWDGAVICVSPGIYSYFDFKGRSVTVTSEDASDWDVVDSTIISNDNGYCVYMQSGEDSGSVLKGFALHGAGGVLCQFSSGVIQHCRVDTIYGIYCYAASDSTVLDNEIENSMRGIYMLSARPIAKNNKISNCQYGIIHTFYSAGFIENNTIHDCTTIGLSMVLSVPQSLKNNLLYNNSKGINVGGANCDFTGNTIVKNNIGIYIVCHSLSSPIVNVSNCILWDNADDIVISDPNYTYQLEVNYSCTQTEFEGMGNINLDPEFVDSDANDFSLSADSPCIDAGDPNGNYEGQLDIEGQPRVAGEAVDMGADEYVTILNISTNTAYDTIQAAIDAANTGDVIVVMPGTYTGTGNRDIDFGGKAITLRSVDPDDYNIVDATIIDCQATAEDRHRGFNFHSGEDDSSILSGLTVIHGRGLETSIEWLGEPFAWYPGGAVCCDNSSPAIIDCVFKDNVDDDELSDGTIACFNSANPHIENCILTNNSFEWAGGISCWIGSSPEIMNCQIKNNTAAIGGVSCFTNCNPIIQECDISDNSIFLSGSHSSGAGGVFCFDASSPFIENCIFRNNYADYGGALYYEENCDVVMKNCLMADNYATRAGGAVNGYYGDSQFINCTIINNTAGWYWGGGLMFGLGGNPVVTNCIIHGNSAPEGSQVFHVSTYPTYSYCDIQDSGGSENWNIPGGINAGGNLDLDPEFAVDGYHLGPVSPCINMGDPNGNYDGQLDIDNQDRVFGGIVDIGADELIGGTVYNLTIQTFYNSIQSAVSDAENDDVIIVYPGTHEESIVLSGKIITLRSLIPDNWAFAEATVLTSETDTTIFANGGDFIVQGLTIRNTADGDIRGIYIFDTPSIISHCIVEEVTYDGIACDGGSPAITNCILRNNEVGIYGNGSSVTITNCIINNNDWGVFTHDDSGSAADNCTIVSNSTGGVYSDFYYGSATTLTNCILWDNGDDLYGSSATYSCIEDIDSGLGNIHTNPCLDENYHLNSNSPCINAGDPNGNYSGQEDIDNQDRVQGGRVDMGADETFISPLSYWKLDDGSGSVATDSEGPNNGAITDAQWTTGKINDGLQFVSTGTYDGDYIRMENISNQLYNKDYSVSCWVKPDSLGLREIVLLGQDYNIHAFEFYQNYGNLNVRADYGSSVDITISGVFTVDEWVHICLVGSQSGTSVYVNGQWQGSTTAVKNSVYGYELYVGAYGDGRYGFNGIIDEICLYDCDISAGWVNYIYQN